MRLDRRTFMGLGTVATCGFAQRSFSAPADNSPHFVPVQPELFAASGGQPNCWADFDNDGDLDLFVGVKADLPNSAGVPISAVTVDIGAQWDYVFRPDLYFGGGSGAVPSANIGSLCLRSEIRFTLSPAKS